MDRSVPWRRGALEGAVIVGSILLAFAIDAWWEDRAEGIEEREALLALARDFDAASQQLADLLEVRDSALVATESILSLTGPNPDPQYADSLAVLIPTLIRLGSFNPPLGTLDALLGSGKLRLIEDDGLRAALASFPSALESQRQTEQFAADVVFGMLLPYLNRHLPMRQFGLRREGASGFRGDPVGVLSSLEFENLVQNRRMNTQFLLDGLTGLDGRIDDILRMLRQELGR